MRRRMFSVVVATVAVVVLFLALTSGTLLQRIGTRPASVTGAHSALAASTADRSAPRRDGVFDPATCPATVERPTYRPPAVSSQTIDCRPGLYVVTYALSGPSNTRAVPAGTEPKNWPLDGSVHPASQISFTAANGYTALPAPMATPTYYDIYAAQFGQTIVRVTAPKSGYGPYRLEWLKAGRLFTIIAVRGVTNTGPSGVPLDELGKMADSVR